MLWFLPLVTGMTTLDRFPLCRVMTVCPSGNSDTSSRGSLHTLTAGVLQPSGFSASADCFALLWFINFH